MAAISKEIREMSLQSWFPIMMRELGYEKIVRCKDCENCEITVSISHPDTTLYECQLWKYDRDGGYLVKPDGYCYKGVRRESEDAD